PRFWSISRRGGRQSDGKSPRPAAPCQNFGRATEPGDPKGLVIGRLGNGARTGVSSALMTRWIIALALVALAPLPASAAKLSAESINAANFTGKPPSHERSSALAVKGQ